MATKAVRCDLCGHSVDAHVDGLRCALCGCTPQRRTYVQESLHFRSSIPVRTSGTRKR